MIRVTLRGRQGDPVRPSARRSARTAAVGRTGRAGMREPAVRLRGHAVRLVRR
ncbi:hypothetical protein [Streptosporangium roseum]|uniref:hypothetical protein n=1 Tax=Streptosporangium roseum TaxID=2001 RepID=UPI0003166D65|nr:hypothetical protein [Streptosporangium roseum]